MTGHMAPYQEKEFSSGRLWILPVETPLRVDGTLGTCRLPMRKGIPVPTVPYCSRETMTNSGCSSSFRSFLIDLCLVLSTLGASALEFFPSKCETPSP
eukprot:scaffold2156_cov115-Cylindrotheca_fusiformis.AAC.10